MTKTFDERVAEIANEVFGGNATVEVKFDKCRQATVIVNMPMHYFEICECSSGFDDLLELTDGDDKCYCVFRNELLVFVGTETYDEMFFSLLRHTFETCAN